MNQEGSAASAFEEPLSDGSWILLQCLPFSEGDGCDSSSNEPRVGCEAASDICPHPAPTAAMAPRGDTWVNWRTQQGHTQPRAGRGWGSVHHPQSQSGPGNPRAQGMGPQACACSSTAPPTAHSTGRWNSRGQVCRPGPSPITTSLEPLSIKQG